MWRPITVLSLGAIALGQSFEVASIRPASASELEAIRRSGRSPFFAEQGISISGSRVTVLGLTTATLIRAAFNLRATQLQKGPGWIATDSYDITATANSPNVLHFDDVRHLLQALLAERFQLQFHREMKEGAAYSLIVGKNGPKVQQSAASEYRTSVNAGSSQVQMNIAHATIAQLCLRLATFVDRPVVDKTDLPGLFDLKLEFAPEGAEDSRELPSIFTAIQEQAGLKLEPAKAPIEFLVIDRIDRPTAN